MHNNDNNKEDDEGMCGWICNNNNCTKREAMWGVQKTWTIYILSGSHNF